jgi:hypothetical protein
MSISEATPTCTVRVGPLAYEIRSVAPGLIDALIFVYPGFTGAAVARPDLRLEVTVIGRERELYDPEPALHLQGNRLIIDAPGYQGILESDGTAHLEVSTVNPVGEVDLFLRIVTAVLALWRGGILMHTAGVVHEGKAYLFFGHSGSGKTTSSRLSAPRQVLNDDGILLFLESEGWVAYGTPFTNPTQVPPSPGRAPLGGIYRLVKDSEVFIAPISSAALLAELLSCVPILAAMPQEIAHVMQIETDIIQKVVGGYLHFRKDPSFWEVIPGANNR